MFKDLTVAKKNLFQQYLVTGGNETPEDNGICHMQAAVILSGSY